MSSFFKRIRRAARASLEVHDVAKFFVRGEPVICPMCRGDEFVRVPDREVKRPLFMGLNLPWLKLDRFSTTLICTHCTHLLSFARAPERVERED